MHFWKWWTRHAHWKWIHLTLWNLLFTLVVVETKRRNMELEDPTNHPLPITSSVPAVKENTAPVVPSPTTDGIYYNLVGTTPNSALPQDVTSAASASRAPNRVQSIMKLDKSQKRKATPNDGVSEGFVEAKETDNLVLITPRFQGSSSVKKTRRIPERQWTSDEERLYNYLFRRYNRAIRPVRKATETVRVALTFSLLQIHRLDEKSQLFRTYGWLIVEWTDERLSWSLNTFDNMTEFVVESTRIWIPEITLINAVEFQFPDFSNYRAIIGYDGRIRWEPAGVFETSCKIDITFYPYDIQDCSLVFGTWSYTSFKLNMTNSTPEVILDDYKTNGEWSITSTKVTREEFMYECCPNIRFSKVSATVHLVRRHRFYTMNLIMPCAMLSSLTLVTFLSPPDQGEKISLGISILLSFSVFMLQLSENMPKTSETLPLFGIYTTFVMMMNTWSVMLTVLVLNLHHRNEHKPVPKWVRVFVFEGLSRILCMYSRTHKRKQDYHKMVAVTEMGDNRKTNRSQRLKTDSLKDGYSVNFASPKYSGSTRIVTSTGFTSATSGDVSKHAQSTPPSRNSTSNTYSANEDFNSKPQDAIEALLETPQYINYDLQEWKRVARVVDRLFFWLTLLALISVSVGMLCLLWT